MKEVLRKLEFVLDQSDPNVQVLPFTREEVQWIVNEIRATGRVVDPSPARGHELRMAKAKQTGDVRYVTAEDVLIEALERVRQEPKDRNVRAMIFWHTYPRGEEDAPVRCYRLFANITTSRIIANLTSEQHQAVDEWNSPR